MARNDVHSPKNFNPSDYEVIEHFGYMSFEDPGGEYIKEAYGYEAVEHVYEKDGQNADNPHPDAEQCDVCGTRFVHGAVMVHNPTGKAITIGGQCLTTIAEVRHLTDGQRLYAAKKAHTRRMRAGKLRKLLAAHPGLNQALKTDHHISRDLRAKVLQWGELSDKQVKLAFKLVDQVAERAATEPEKRPVPTEDKRHTVEATILGTKLVDGYMGGQDEKWLLMVEIDGGAFKLWGGVPQAVADAQWDEDRKRLEADPERDDHWPVLKGAVVKFTARFEVSKDDPSFGFVKRPTKVSVLKWGDE